MEDPLDPLSAIGLAKAANAAVATTETVAKSGVFQALVMPTARAYGDHWGKNVKEKLQAAKEVKKESNLSAHLEVLRSKVKEDSQADPTLVQDWLEGVENIDPIDKDLSTAWRGVLLSIADGSLYRKRLLDVVKNMTAGEAHAFMLIAKRTIVTQDDTISEYRSGLEKLGLTRRPAEVILNSSIFIFSTALLILTTILWFIPVFLFLQPKNLLSGVTQLTNATATFCVIVLLLPLMYEVFKAIRYPRLTKLGYALAKVSTKIVEDVSVEAKAEAPETKPTEFIRTPDGPPKTSTARKSGKKG